MHAEIHPMMGIQDSKNPARAKEVQPESFLDDDVVVAVVVVAGPIGIGMVCCCCCCCCGGGGVGLD